jgi:hypothetical protein
MSIIFNAALSLNNTAISLSQQACYDQAVDTLRDAVHLMKISKDGPSTLDETLVCRMLNKALHCTSNPRVSTGPAQHLPVIVSHNESGLVLYDKSLDDSYFFFLVHFDTSDDELLEASDDELIRHLTHATIVYNFACCSMCVPEKEGCGVQCLDYTISKLAKLFSVTRDDHFFLNRVVLVSILALHARATAHLARGQTEQARDNCTQMSFLAQVATALKESAWALCAAAA